MENPAIFYLKLAGIFYGDFSKIAVLKGEGFGLGS
jgi:hypothetical protein